MQHDALLPRPPGGLAPGVALSLLVHAGLLVALTLAVDWHMKAPETASAELWSALPQVAAPPTALPAPTPAPAPTPTPAPAPPPAPAPLPKQAAPPEPDIAIQRAERRKALEREQKAADTDKAEKARLDEKKRAAETQKAKEAKEAQAAEEARLAKSRDEQLKRLFGSLPASGASNGSASQDSAPSQAYAGRLRKAIRDNVRFAADTLSGNPTAEVEVRATPGGTILSRTLRKSSGVKEWDEAVLRAIDRTATLPQPRPGEGRIPETLLLEMRPKE